MYKKILSIVCVSVALSSSLCRAADIPDRIAEPTVLLAYVNDLSKDGRIKDTLCESIITNATEYNTRVTIAANFLIAYIGESIAEMQKECIDKEGLSYDERIRRLEKGGKICNLSRVISTFAQANQEGDLAKIKRHCGTMIKQWRQLQEHNH